VFGPVEEEFARAAHVVKRHLRWARSGGQPIETCGAVASFDEASEKFTIYVNSSMYNYIGFTVAAALKVASHQVNLVPLDAGGSFGSKLFLHKVAVLAGLAARTAGRPVKYIEDRIDNITACDNHGSDRTYDVELALDSNYRMTALRYKVVDDYGAYFQYGLGTHGNGFSQTVGPYKIRAVGAEIYAAFTYKCQQGACRGFGSEVTNFMIERIVDAAVDELNLDPIAFRRDNFIPQEEFPYQIRPATSMAAAIIPAPSTWRCRCWTTTAGARNSSSCGRRGAMSASAWRAARKRECSAPPNSGCSTACPALR
jgi:CO/xanthine dehydrogenase Mo-binding subunit